MNTINIINYCITGLLSLLVLLIVVRLIWSLLAKAVTVSATVTDKRKSSYTKYTPVPQPVTDYILVFTANNGKKLNFTTNPWNYEVIKKGDKGILKYRGNRFISFEPK